MTKWTGKKKIYIYHHYIISSLYYLLLYTINKVYLHSYSVFILTLYWGIRAIGHQDCLATRTCRLNTPPQDSNSRPWPRSKEVNMKYWCSRPLGYNPTSRVQNIRIYLGATKCFIFIRQLLVRFEKYTSVVTSGDKGYIIDYRRPNR